MISCPKNTFARLQNVGNPIYKEHFDLPQAKIDEIFEIFSIFPRVFPNFPRNFFQAGMQFLDSTRAQLSKTPKNSSLPLLVMKLCPIENRKNAKFIENRQNPIYRFSVQKHVYFQWKISFNRASFWGPDFTPRRSRGEFLGVLSSYDPVLCEN